MQDSSQGQMTSATKVTDLLPYFRNYAQTRIKFLAAMNQPTSCRDPLAEFSETLVAALLDARMAGSRVQKGYDLIRSNGRRVQVRYLCNPGGGWINEHYIYFADGIDDYALVVIEGLELGSVLLFRRETIGQVATLLKKRHANRDTSIRFTQQNYRSMLSRSSDFMAVGVEIYRPERAQRQLVV